MCSWTQRSDDEFDWLQHSGSTSDSTSGPDRDHTTGKGKYLLISGKSHRLGWTADLSSPYLFVTRENNMTFWYYMNGAGIGNLSVIVTDRYGGKTNIWHKHGRQSADWQRATVSLGILTSFITFEGSIKLHYGADIALDDITISKEPIVYTTSVPPSTIATTTESSIPNGIDLSCNFEHGFCHWRQDNITDDFDWQITHLRSPDPTSGPEGDHTNGNGNYLLLDGHKVHNYNWSATFSSPQVNIQQYTNMSFWYHMNGVGIGHLAVYAEYSNGHRDTLVFMSGRQSPEWQHVTVELPPGIYKLIFEGSARYHYGSNMALDDITVQRIVFTIGNIFG